MAPRRNPSGRPAHIPHVVLGTLDVPWTFLVFEKSEHQAILGLDFMRAHGLLYDPRTDLLITLRKEPPGRPLQPRAMRARCRT